jgi:DNA-binding IscR family transcriptional regulator
VDAVSATVETWSEQAVYAIHGFTDYCLRLLMFLAAYPESRATIAELAGSYDISENHLIKVAHSLGQAGF